MTTIAWDGETLVSDMQATSGQGLKYAYPKIRILTDRAIVACGATDQCLALMRWYEEGAFKDKWPDFQKSDSYNILVVVTDEKDVFSYHALPEPIRFHNKYMAWGSGRDFALGSMYHEKYQNNRARRAVEVACLLDESTGVGIQVWTPGERSVETRDIPHWTDHLMEVSPSEMFKLIKEPIDG